MLAKPVCVLHIEEIARRMLEGTLFITVSSAVCPECEQAEQIANKFLRAALGWKNAE